MTDMFFHEVKKIKVERKKNYVVIKVISNNREEVEMTFFPNKDKGVEVENDSI